MSDFVEGPRVLGLGLGLFLLILLWSFSLLAVLIFSRMYSGTGVLITSFAIIVTAVMLAMPRSDPVYKDKTVQEDKEPIFRIYDTIFIWKVILSIIMGVFSIGGGGYFFYMYLTDSVYAEVVKKKRY